MINFFLQKKISLALEKASTKEYKDYILKQGLFLNELNINNEKDLLKFHYIVQYIPSITKQLYGKCNKQACAKITEEVFRNFSEIKSYAQIKNIIFNYVKTGLIKTAYPIDMSDNEKIINYDINKWRSAINDIHIRSRIFGNKKDAIDFVTKDWGNMDEKLAFERWLKFYEQKGHTNYKISQHIITDNIVLPYIPGLTKKQNQESNANEREYELDERNKAILNHTKGKLLGRIDSAIKILHSNTGMDFAGKEYNKLVDTLLSLKGDIMKIKSSLILDDLIVRASTSLNDNSSYIKQLFIKIAQLPPLTETPTDAPATGIEDPNKPAEAEGGSKKNGDKAIKEFVTNQITNVFDVIDKKRTKAIVEKENLPENQNTKKENKFAWYNINTEEFIKFQKVCSELKQVIKAAKNFNNITKVAQETPEPAITQTNVPIDVPIDAPVEETTAPVENTVPTESIEQKLESDKKEKASPFLDVSDTIDDALNSIKLSDVIKQLQALSRVFKNREIARQLSIIDLMLNKLGISGFFPALAEATRSALESNQYCQTRVEEILSKLISATDERGLSEFDSLSKMEEKETNADNNMIDEEMKGYLEKPKKIETKEQIKPEPKIETAPKQAPETVQQPEAPIV